MMSNAHHAHEFRRRCSSVTVIMSFVLITILVVMPCPTKSFHYGTIPRQTSVTRKRKNVDLLQVALPTRSTAAMTQLHALVDGPVAAVDDFFRTEPFLAAFLACSVKASAADFLAQTSNDDTEEEENKHRSTKKLSQSPLTKISTTMGEVDMQRNLAFLLYGGLYQGMFLQFLYVVLYPTIYGGSPLRVPLSVCTDIFFFGPLVTLPLAYIIRAVIDSSMTVDNTIGNEGRTTTGTSTFSEAATYGIEKYKGHVLTEGLLFKFWMIWGPAQSINFGLVPEHLRVFFVAFVSFFWVYLLSAISSRQYDQTPKATTA